MPRSRGLRPRLLAAVVRSKATLAFAAERQVVRQSDMAAPLSFEDLPLHDAVLREVVVDWKNRSCRVHVSAFLDPGAAAVPCTLTWTDVKEVRVPMFCPWGSSVSINRQAKEGSTRYLIEVQSGDVIVIEAADGVFERDTSAAV
jgi:hypothetical protein